MEKRWKKKKNKQRRNLLRFVEDIREATWSSLTEKPLLACAGTGFNGGFDPFMEEKSRPVAEKRRKTAPKVEGRLSDGEG